MAIAVMRLTNWMVEMDLLLWDWPLELRSRVRSLQWPYRQKNIRWPLLHNIQSHDKSVFLRILTVYKKAISQRFNVFAVIHDYLCSFSMSVTLERLKKQNPYMSMRWDQEGKYSFNEKKSINSSNHAQDLPQILLMLNVELITMTVSTVM